MWMAVYVRPPRPHVPVINHCPHRPPTGLVERDRLFKMAPDQSECAWKCTDECQTRGCFHLQMSPLRKAVPNDAMMSVKQAGSCWRAVSSVSVADEYTTSSSHVHMLWMRTCWLYSPCHLGLSHFHFLCCWDAMGINAVLFVAQQGLRSLKKNTFEGVESFPSRWKKKRKTSRMEIWCYFVTTFLCLS